ncbi:MAG: TatD family hydrolase [bacterium]|nr:TatD family hydrolase [bacterium]
MFADTHCHLDFKEFDRDLNKVIRMALEEKVRIIINPGIDLDSSIKAVEISKKYECVYAACGIHPHNAAGMRSDEFDRCMKLIENEKVVAVGETGLDFYYHYSDRNSQIELFKKHIFFSKKIDKPLIVHQRNAEDELMDVFEDTGCPSKVVFHCFGGDEKLFEWIIAKGFYVSFTGILTFKNAKTLRLLAEKVPLDKVFFETDAPYLAPFPLRGKRNEPRFVRIIVEEFSGLRKIPLNELAQMTTENAKKFFSID